MIESFVFYRSFAESLKDMDNDTYRRLMDALLNYALNDEEPQLRGLEQSWFIACKANVDSNSKKRKNGEKGGRPKKDSLDDKNGGFEEKTTGLDNKPMVSNEKPMVSNEKPMVFNAKPNENETENETENANEDVNENENTPPINPPEGNESEKLKRLNAKKEKERQAEELFNDLWKLYPRKEGKGSVSITQKKKLLAIGREEMTRCIERFVEAKKDKEERYLPYGSSFFNSGYVDYLDENFKPKEKPPDVVNDNSDDNIEISDEEWLAYQRSLAEQDNELHTV